MGSRGNVSPNAALPVIRAFAHQPITVPGVIREIESLSTPRSLRRFVPSSSRDAMELLPSTLVETRGSDRFTIRSNRVRQQLFAASCIHYVYDYFTKFSAPYENARIPISIGKRTAMSLFRFNAKKKW